MPPGDSLDERNYQPVHLDSVDEKMEEIDWEDRVMSDARYFKSICDELKEAGCPLFGGEYREDLPSHIREKAALLNSKLDSMLSFDFPMSSSSSCDKLRLFVAQGESMKAFQEKMKAYDFCLKCNAVWSSDAIAYRCNTCAFNPCMSLCLECFQNANHEGHDFNRFFSQAGGACDCGNSEVLRESGFCSRHGRNAKRPPAPTPNIVSLDEYVIPKLFVRLLLHFRGWSKRYLEMLEERANTLELSKEMFSNQIVGEVNGLIELIQTMVDFGGPLRDAVARTLLDTSTYAALSSRTSEDDWQEDHGRIDFSLDWRSQRELDEDAKSLFSVQGAPQISISFTNMLDELIFYMVRLIFPQNIINLCLSMLSDIEYRDHFACRFFSLYSCIAEVMVDLAKTERNSAIYAVSARIIHSTVQILSSEAMCLKLDDEMHLIRVIVQSTQGLLGAGTQVSSITQDKMSFYSNVPPSAFRGPEFDWKVYSLENNKPLRKHSYWTLVSDMQNLLGHPSIARRFLRDQITLNSYAAIISRMQGMNAMFRLITGEHVEFDSSQPYQLSFHLEWEVAATNMFNILSALSDEVDCMTAYLTLCKHRLQDWLISICMGESDLCTPPFVITYHIALHRHLAAGIQCCLGHSAFRHILSSTLESDEPFMRKLALHPLKIQVCRAETAAGMWARNGNAARNMSFYYAQTNYNTAFLDCDLALLRYIATICEPVWFLDAWAASFFLDECLKTSCLSEGSLMTNRIVTRKEWCISLIEGALRLIIELVTIRWNVGGSEMESIEKEIVAALAISDLTHSKLRGSIPEQGNRSSAVDDHLDELLSKVAHYDEPDQGSHIQQGVYRLTNESWRDRFDPVFCCTRATIAREYNDALLRVEEVEKSSASRTMLLRLSGHFWTPYKLVDFDVDPSVDHYSKISNIFVSPVSFAVLRRVLTMHILHQHLNEDIIQKAVFLLTLAAKFAISKQFTTCYKPSQHFNSLILKDLPFDRKKPRDINDRSFVFSMFTYNAGNGHSILSLLLHYIGELFSAMDSRIDSKRLVAEALLEQLQKPAAELYRISGGAVEYIGRLLNILYHHDSVSKREIDKYIGDIPEEARATKSDDAIAKSKAERRLAAKRHQEAVLAAIMKKNASVMLRMMNREGLSQSQMDEMDTSVKSEVRHYECPICSDTTTSTLAHPVGLLVHPFANYILAQSVSRDEPNLSLLELDAEALSNNECLPERIMLKHCRMRHREILEKNFSYADLLQLETNIDVRSCGHFAHISCFDAYVETLTDARSLRLNPADSRIEILCPMCRGVAHGLLPLAPDFDCERTRLNLTTSEGRIANQACYQAVFDSLKNRKPSLSESEAEQFITYRQSFINFTGFCRRQTVSDGEGVSRVHSHGQSFTLGLVKTNIERNVLMAELQLVDPSDRAVSTEHLLYGACYEATTRDLTFARLQCKQLLFDDEKEDLLGDETLRASLFDPKIGEEYNFCDEDDETVDESPRYAVVCLNIPPQDERSFPLPLVDMKSVLLRLSAYVITRNNLFKDDKLRLLTFIYNRILLAAIARTAVLVAGRMPLSQLKRILKQNFEFATCTDFSSYMTAFAEYFAGKLMSHQLVNAEDLLSLNTEEVYFREAILYAAADLSRFTAELWHECDIKKIPGDINVGRASGEELHKFLSVDVNTDSQPDRRISTSLLSSWIESIACCMRLRRFVWIVAHEPVMWRPFILLDLPLKYDDLFSRFFGRRCVNCDTIPRTPLICLLCSKLVCLDSCCSTPVPANPGTFDNEVEKHSMECGNGAGCFIALNSSLIVIIARHVATIWGSVYLDAHGEEDRNLKRGKPLYLSKRRFEKLCADWVLQNFDQLVVSPFSFEHLPTFLREAHLVANY